MRCFVVLLMVGGFWVDDTLSAATIIHAGRLIDGRSDELQTEMSIVVEEGRITKVVPGFLKPAEGDKLIDLSTHTVMPGLMDMHTHLMGQHSKDSYTEKFFMEESDYALRSTMFARATLMAGFTSVSRPGAMTISICAIGMSHAALVACFLTISPNSASRAASR